MAAPKGNDFGKTENKWSTSEDLLMAEGFESGLSLEEVAELLGRTVRSVELRCYRVRHGRVKQYSRKARTILNTLSSQGVSMNQKKVPVARKRVRKPKPAQSKKSAQKPKEDQALRMEPEGPSTDSMSHLWIGFVSGIAFASSVFAIAGVYYG